VNINTDVESAYKTAGRIHTCRTFRCVCASLCF